MKKNLLAVFCALVFAISASSQVMSSSGVKNTLWTGFGKPLNGDFSYYGFIDTIQARVDVGQFTLEGMVNWGAVANMNNNGNLDNFTFEMTNLNPLVFHYNEWQGTTKLGQTVTDDYYVNFLWHPFTNFDVGLGTKLNWTVGAAPSYGSYLWEDRAHVRQGGFATSYTELGDFTTFTPDVPGSADVVGFVPYANRFANKALGVRYYFENSDFNVQFGGAIPSGTNTDNMRLNVGANFGFQKFSLALAYQGLFQKDGNLYAGASFGVNEFFFDVYGALDGIDTEGEDMSYSLGAAMTIDLKKYAIFFRPEGAFNWFQNGNYTPAWYAGLTFDWGISKNIYFNAYGSLAFGSAKKDWKDNNYTKDWFGGMIVDLRPMIEFELTNRHSLSAYVDMEWRTSYDNVARNCFSTGVFWSYNFDVSNKKRR